MANRSDRTTHQRTVDSTTHSESHLLFCHCGEPAVNTVKIIRLGKPEFRHRCRAHTTKYDILVAGPGPLED